ncbi:methyl-accepting chemotaxis protein [Fulvimarina sp. 2208YS6-2-32]|uniref:Methyl-accepting chemotaxis protein n=1 Tax=Fulvimarina uroteuthidis TaxID=3098149 RepID=A0ABU5I4L6_9HYPH|nr:methyl-accepting chemotaxis protein [Fulvimarina sp. 2208YS6-2-32]MDY8110323.1 methyl-accepting chemotaxis protein [Fulvimarina sp. 2208YS6-2-32]
MVVSTGAAIATIVLAYTGFNAWRAIDKTEDAVMALASEKAAQVAQRTAVDISQATAAGAALAGTLSGYLAQGTPDRAEIVAMLETVAPQYKNIYGAWMAHLVDTPEADIVPGDLANNAEGIFTPYWTKNDQGGVEFSTFSIKTGNEYYAAPLTSGQSVVTSPYLTPTKSILTSVSVPVRVDGRIVGLTGVDIRLDELNAVLGAMVPFEGGEVRLLANNGNWLVNSDRTQLMEPYAGLGSDKVRTALDSGEMQVIEGLPDGTVRLVYPFTAPGMNTTWAVVLDVPSAVFTAPVWSEIKNTVLGGVVILLVALLVIILVSRGLIGRPLSRILAGVETMIRGDYAKEIEGTGRSDELGTLASALEKFRHDLANGELVKLEQDQLQKRVESERERQTNIDNSKAEDLRHFVHLVEAGFNRLSTGDLTVRMDEAVSPDFEPIRSKFNESVGQLEETIAVVIGSVQSIRSGLAEISVASNDLAQRTEQQAASIEETVAALSEVSQGVGQTARKSGDARKTAASALEKAREGGAIVGRAVKAMEEIESSSSKINEIISVIDEIAFQTNLLALNAGVEAARAGEAGKGFAVVAQEVRELAQRSARAAKQIKELISKSRDQVGTGVELVTASGTSLEEIVAEVNMMSEVISSIAAAADEQATSLREVNSTADHMDKVTQQNAAMVEETTAATTNLQSETNLLGAAVEGFNVSRHTAKAAPAAPSRPGPVAANAGHKPSGSPVHAMQQRLTQETRRGHPAPIASGANAVDLNWDD